ncbi:hypothetical protein JW824_10970 [bacterium]|nr:hypothetical protein [bacterium]
MKRLFYVCLSIIFLAAVYGQRNEENRVIDEKTFIGDQVDFPCIRPDTDESIVLRATVPKGWKVNPDFGTVVYQPADADDYYEPPMIEFQARCEGECKAEVIQGNIDAYVQRLKEGWKKLSTGDPELDALGAIVETIEEEKSDGQWLLEVKLTYPEGVSDAMYPPRYYVYRFLHDSQDPFFILIKGIVPVSLADQFLSDVVASCLSTVQLRRILPER